MPSLSVDKITNWLNSIISHESATCGDLNYIFCSDMYLLKLNKEYLNHDYYTDVITFDYTENNIISGDIFISVDRVKDNAKVFSVLFDIEMKRILAHGLLHLLGYNDKSEEEKKQMTKLENKYLDLYNN